MAYPSIWAKPKDADLQNVVEVTKLSGSCHRFADAFVKEIKVEDEDWFLVKKIEDNTNLYHFPKDTVKKVTLDGKVLFELTDAEN